MVGDVTAAGVKRYPNVWKKYFPKSVSLGIGGILWHANNIDLPNST